VPRLCRHAEGARVENERTTRKELLNCKHRYQSLSTNFPFLLHFCGFTCTGHSAYLKGKRWIQLLSTQTDTGFNLHRPAMNATITFQAPCIVASSPADSPAAFLI
jgi:hypothetical protein